MLKNIKDDKIIPVLHGENFLVPVKKLPKGETTETKMFIVGHSETGHHHVLESEEPFTVHEKEMYLQLFKPAKLVHTKDFDIHETIKVLPGIYKINHKTEYDPFAKVVRAVFD